ncbi:MAG: sulfatase-like hydrolase/transferase, partial [Planctomycetaceae bacterium]|nr:sulfatase-like hydrolase/transferase [Planctomycetaceae bacterium]
MKTSRVLFPLISCLILMVNSVYSAEEPSGASRPNVLFIAVDDLRPSIGCYGDPMAVTPNLDRLARRSVRFDRAYCQVAVCNPSRASLMTGQRPDQLGVWTLPIHFREAKPDAVTLPQWFRKFGYTAVSHGKIFHNPTPDPQSWSEPIRPLPQLPSSYPPGTAEQIRATQKELPANDWRKNNLRGPSTGAPVIEDDQLVDGARTQMAIEDLKRLGKAKAPFFLAMGYIRPHLPWVAPKKYWDLHDPAKLPVITDGNVTPNTPPYALSDSYELTHYVDLIDFPKPWNEERIDEKTARHLMHAYFASVSYIDA